MIYSERDRKSKGLGANLTRKNSRPKVETRAGRETWWWMEGRTVINPAVPVRFAGVICATKWPLAGIILWVDACRNNDTVKHGYLFM